MWKGREKKELKGHKEEEVFDEMVEVDVQVIRGYWRFADWRQSSIEWSAQSKCREHPESARMSAEIWYSICTDFHLTTCVRITR